MKLLKGINSLMHRHHRGLFPFNFGMGRAVSRPMHIRTEFALIMVLVLLGIASMAFWGIKSLLSLIG